MPTHFEHIMKYLGSKKEWSRKMNVLLHLGVDAKFSCEF